MYSHGTPVYTHSAATSGTPMVTTAPAAYHSAAPVTYASPYASHPAFQPAAVVHSAPQMLSAPVHSSPVTYVSPQAVTASHMPVHTPVLHSVPSMIAYAPHSSVYSSADGARAAAQQYI